MNTVTGIVTLPKRNKYVMLPGQYIDSFELDLAGGEWNLGIDQSTSCTGLCLERTDGFFRVLLDVSRDKALETKRFYRDLFKILAKLAKGCSFKYVIMEKPAPKDMYASRVLQELKGRVEEWVGMIPEFEDAVVDSLFPQTWKSYMVDKSKGKNRHRDKLAVAEDISERFPLLLPYYVHYPYTDYDSFDACGILNGYMQYAFNSVGEPQIHGSIEKRHVSVVGYRWVDSAKVGENSEAFSCFCACHRPEVLAFNERYNLHENIRMASSSHEFVITILPKQLLQPFMWKYDIDIDEDKTMVMYVLRKGKFSSADMALFKEAVPWNEEVFNE